MFVMHVVGARPNFMKAAPVMAALEGIGCRQLLVHTGQHYDEEMSEVFFDQLGMPRPDENLEVGSASHAVQTAEIMVRFEGVLRKSRPDLVLVYGDVNSTVAAALVAAKMGIPIGHVEAGLRSFDRSMPEEINRLLTDQLADLLFTPSADGNQNLEREGIPEERVHLVGNTMIDTLVRMLPLIRGSEVLPAHGLRRSEYILVTLHRPSNVDQKEVLSEIFDVLSRLAARAPVLFPMHPRTRRRIDEFGIAAVERIRIEPPLGYIEFMALQEGALAVITDSGGIQEETTFLGIPCFTLRDSTERPVTITHGTNVLVGSGDLQCLPAQVLSAAGGKYPAEPPPLWDGQAGERIARILDDWFRRTLV